MLALFLSGLLPIFLDDRNSVAVGGGRGAFGVYRSYMANGFFVHVIGWCVLDYARYLSGCVHSLWDQDRDGKIAGRDL